MDKVLIFNFDGTDNEPQDAVQEVNKKGEIEDDGITNILKFHLLIGGELKGTGTELNGGHVTFYYNGVGTYGNFFERKINAALAIESKDVRTILREARKDFEDYYLNKGGFTKILVTGFSRGGALARRFASIINDHVSGQVIIEGIYDTVASIGLPNLSKKDRPSSNVVFEHGHTLPSNVERALHLVSLDDKRKAFQPTLMNREDRVQEVWFAGAHSDVGGGYYYDGLSDTAFRYFLDWFDDLNLGIHVFNAKSLDYTKIPPEGAKYQIKADDVQIDPDTFGTNHQQERNLLLRLATLADRRCCVIKNDRVDESELPMVHWSIADRVHGDRNYRPRSLENLPHRVTYSDGDHKDFEGYSDHKYVSKRNWHILGKSGDSYETFVFAYKKYNHTGILFEAGVDYRIEVIETDQYKWRDGDIEQLDGEGWDRGDISWGLKELPIRAMEPFRRVTLRGVNWFTLCGTIGENDDKAFIIGNQVDYQAESSGQFCAFANDLKGYYGNNRGKLKIRVTRMS